MGSSASREANRRLASKGLVAVLTRVLHDSTLCMPRPLISLIISYRGTELSTPIELPVQRRDSLAVSLDSKLVAVQEGTVAHLLDPLAANSLLCSLNLPGPFAEQIVRLTADGFHLFSIDHKVIRKWTIATGKSTELFRAGAEIGSLSPARLLL